MTESISLNKYINKKYDPNRLEKAVVGFQCTPEVSNEMSCKVTFGKNLSFDSYARYSHDTVYIEEHNKKLFHYPLSITSINCEAGADNSLECYLETIIDFSQEDNKISLDDHIKKSTDRSISKIDCLDKHDSEDSSLSTGGDFQCSISLGDPIIDIDNYVANLTNKAVTNVVCSEATYEMQEATCSIYLT